MRKIAFLCVLSLLVGILSGCSGLIVTTTPPTEFSYPTITEPTEPTLPENPYLSSDFVLENGMLSCTAGQAVPGIDVSYYQKDINWAKVKEAGIQFAIIRLGARGYETGELRTDVRAAEYLRDAKAAGLKIGAYFYSQAISVEEALEEARYALSILGDVKLDMPLVFDWEQEDRTAYITPRTLTDCTLAFCKAIEDAGHQAMIYFNVSQGANLLYLQELTEYAWWLAMYDTQSMVYYRIDMWQYTDHGTIPGIEGYVDLNLLFTDYGLGAQVFGKQN